MGEVIKLVTGLRELPVGTPLTPGMLVEYGGMVLEVLPGHHCHHRLGRFRVRKSGLEYCLACGLEGTGGPPEPEVGHG